MKPIKKTYSIVATIGLFFLLARPLSSLAQATPPTNDVATTIATVQDNSPILMWSSGNKLFIDFSKVSEVQAEIEVYAITGQQLYSDKLTTNVLYTKEITRVPTSYILVKLTCNSVTLTRKLLIVNN